jgi:hypothetical protein
MFRAQIGRVASVALAAGVLAAVPVVAGASGPQPSRAPVLRATLPGPLFGGGSGFAVAVSGPTAVVGSLTSDVAFIYTESGGTWPTTPTVTLSDPGSGPSDQFGSAVAVSGTTMVIGDHGSGVVYIYTESGGTWPTTPTVTLDDAGGGTDGFGWSVAVSPTTAVVGAPVTSGGVAYVYTASGGTWSPSPTAIVKDPAGTAGDWFGNAVAVSGKNVMVGAYRTSAFSGAAYLYTQAHHLWPTTPTTSLLPSDSGGGFGISVALSGKVAVVGEPLASGDAGTAFVYLSSGGSWPSTPSVTLSDPGSTPAGYFGWKVSATNSKVAVSAIGDASGDGAEYLYGKSHGLWSASPQHQLADPGATPGDDFGSSVSLAGSTVLVGAVGGDGGNGVAYVFS